MSIIRASGDSVVVHFVAKGIVTRPVELVGNWLLGASYVAHGGVGENGANKPLQPASGAAGAAQVETIVSAARG